VGLRECHIIFWQWELFDLTEGPENRGAMEWAATALFRISGDEERERLAERARATTWLRKWLMNQI